MIIEHIKSTTVITQEKTTLAQLVNHLNDVYDDLKNNNIVVNLFSLNASLKASNLNEFLLLSEKHKATKHSFVIVASSVNIDEVSEQLNVVPTLTEAHDIIEMEEIERDLGF